jgi:alcohol dehydrogenase, propanol-preferring
VFAVSFPRHLALQYANLFGGTVIGVDIEDSKLDLARQLGADHVVNACVDEVLAGHVPARVVFGF